QAWPVLSSARTKFCFSFLGPVHYALIILSGRAFALCRIGTKLGKIVSGAALALHLFANMPLPGLMMGGGMRHNEVEFCHLRLLSSAAGGKYRAYPSEQRIEIPAFPPSAISPGGHRKPDAGLARL